MSLVLWHSLQYLSTTLPTKYLSIPTDCVASIPPQTQNTRVARPVVMLQDICQNTYSMISMFDLVNLRLSCVLLIDVIYKLSTAGKTLVDSSNYREWRKSRHFPICNSWELKFKDGIEKYSLTVSWYWM